MPIRIIRGAISVPENTRASILDATREMLLSLMELNGLEKEDVLSAIFSATSDLDAAYPAEAARALGWTEAGLMCVQEMNVRDSLPMCLRVMVMAEMQKRQADVRHCYLREAKSLRPDLLWHIDF